MKRVGWLLDASVDHKRQALTLWIKVEGKTRGYVYHGFSSSVFVRTDLLDSHNWTDSNLLGVVREHDGVLAATITEKFVSVYDAEKKRVLQIFTTPDMHWEVTRDLEKLPGATVFHADIDPVQQFFIMQEIFPFGRVEFEEKNGCITTITCLDSREDVEYEIPELDEIRIEVFADTDRIVPDVEDPIHHIEIHHRDGVIRVEDVDEQRLLTAFQETIGELDPDVVVTRGGDDTLFRYLTLRANLNGVQLTLSRDGTPLRVVQKKSQSFWQYNQIVYRPGNQVMFTGRIHIDRGESLYYSPSGIEGIIEGCRLAFAQPQRVARMSIGSVNAAVQYYNAFKMDILIPPIKRNPEFLKSISDLRDIDRGGLILQPKPDIYEDIAECDFSSMYPTLMVTRNISPETICTRDQCPYDYDYCTDVPGLSFKLCTKRRGIVAESLDLVVRKRNEFKRLIEEGKDARKYELMQNTLKGVLVSCFGYLGFKNARFGRVEAHTAVTALAREVMLRTQDIGESMGLELIHGIVDSVWLRSEDKIDHRHVEEFCRQVTDDLDIKMSLKGVYKWLVIPSSRMHPSIAPLNRYYGVYRNGGIKTRGIETRRRDTCLYVGDCQTAMIKTLARGRDKSGFLERIPDAYAVCQSYIDRLHEGDVDLRDLILHSRLTREPAEYRATSRAAIVAQQLVKAGKDLHAGQKVRYVLSSVDSPSPVRRVKAVELIDETVRYDPEAYAVLCERAFENLIPAQYLDKHRPSKPGEETQTLIRWT
ncbi:MAG: hypothetical protein JSW61_12425 [Candidatus Thorarchaeota archaeon]|nr:MAG: hypothetical protein JSW61_12425 [Candidatus Thorarchaeota archaeon]